MNEQPPLKYQDALIEVVDVLSLRGNRLFGDPGSYGEATMPPNPSVIAGALRSSLLLSRGIDLHAFAQGEVNDDILGSPMLPGKFTLCEMQPARKLMNGTIEPLFALPADLVVTNDGGRIRLEDLRPAKPGGSLRASQPLPLWPVLRQPKAAKTAKGFRLPGPLWQRHLEGLFGDEEQEHLDPPLLEESDL